MVANVLESVLRRMSGVATLKRGAQAQRARRAIDIIVVAEAFDVKTCRSRDFGIGNGETFGAGRTAAERR